MAGICLAAERAPLDRLATGYRDLVSSGGHASIRERGNHRMEADYEDSECPFGVDLPVLGGPSWGAVTLPGHS